MISFFIAQSLAGFGVCQYWLAAQTNPERGIGTCHPLPASSSCPIVYPASPVMTPIQNLGLALFVVLSIGFAIGHKTECSDGRVVETYLAKGLASQLLGHDLCQQP
ncbi:hypothetical protein [Pseudomonas sp. o96-267]